MGYRNYFYLVSKKVVEDIQKLDTREDLVKYIVNSNIFHEKVRKKAERILEQKTYEDYYIGIDELGERLHEFGKLYFDGDTYEAITKNGKPLFKKDSELSEYYADYDAQVVGIEALKAVAECYQQKVIKNYENSLKSYDELVKEAKEKDKPTLFIEKGTIEEKLKEDVEEKLYWLKEGVLNFDLEDKYSINNSWLYEYSMFELVHQLKTVNFKKYAIVECGW